MTFDKFNSLWYEAFGWRLNEKGDSEWAEFVDNPKCNDFGISETIRAFAKDYIAAKDSGKSNYKDKVPTLAEFKKRYFDTMPEWKRKQTARDFGRMKLSGQCLVCGGTGRVVALAPCIGDIEREKAPEDWRTVTADRFVSGVEIYPCPICYEGNYHGNHTLRNRVLENSLPEIMLVGHKNNPCNYPLFGQQVMEDYLYNRFASEREAWLAKQNGGKANRATVERQPQHIMTDLELIAEEQRIDDELERFFPMKDRMEAK